MRPRSLRRAGAPLVLAGALVAACAPTIQVHGYVPSQADVAQVTPGVSNYESVEAALGRPSSSGLLRDSSWYYVQSTVESYTYNKPRVIDRVVLAVDFNANGVVEGLTRYGLEDGRIVNLTTRTTETGGRRMGVLEQLFGNLLTLDAEQFQN
ncbi:MAG TPA: outer membrane protein assembly factor BamE [Amaricoccus sp.]|uniref:outer membrane protein assembly factor BamE n=1 Tax=Amaricoccus sp. TaxID=1872485 RepID=UPI001D4B2280|nr:outer membrane protein assembly factor BamE [Amaricoccus sp.]MCB1375140.1 outer membrane protein assembly factor BamE [Paracoccaceae bacterium]MCC0066087.1 outer membrane protein assembly factor BamE [Rhodovulum sp.]HMQ93222.1 outer membrane protein assembly factor BamE [Amaricoccus sp.]HMR53067.1 outer membrane protein assembly factor BamE [Amaricoccus sp.]HMR61065.1 outer membrane protein assembly factor BamE [Amaricoccus sp.]